MATENNITQLSEVGAFSWRKELSGFTGKLVTDKNNYIYALCKTDSDNGEVVRYNSDGAPAGDVSFSFEPKDITYGHDGYIYVCGRDSGGDGYIAKFTTALNTSFTSSAISSDPVEEIRVDQYGLLYVALNSKNIRKYKITLGGSLYQIWEVTDLASGSLTPHIAITKDGNVYATGEALAESWVETFGLDYFTPFSSGYCYCSWAGSKYVLTSMYMICLEVNGAWAEGFRPTKCRMTFGGPNAGMVRFGHVLECISGGSCASYGQSEEYPESPVEFDISCTDDIGAVKLETNWQSSGVYLTNIEFYTTSLSKVVAAITSDGSVTGYISRTNTPGIIALDRSGFIVLQDGDRTIVRIDPSDGSETWSYNTGRDIECFITGVDGAVETNSMEARMVFSADISIGGTAYEMNLVSVTVGGIEFSSSPSVTGYQTVVTPASNKFTFESSAKPVSPISVTAGEMTFDSDAKSLHPVRVQTGQVEFSSSPSVTGYQTVISPLGDLEFSSSGPTVFQTDAPTPAQMAVNDPPTLQITSTTITAQVRDILYYVEAEIPMLMMEAHGGGHIEAEMPMLTMDSDGDAYIEGDVVAEISMASLEMYAGGHVEATIPIMEMDSEASISVDGDFEATIPMVQMSVSGSNEIIAEFEATIPFQKLTITGIGGQVGDVSATIPMPYMSISGITGNVGDVEATMPMIQIDIDGGPGRNGDLEATIPMIYLSMYSGSVESEILRYVRDKVR